MIPERELYYVEAEIDYERIACIEVLAFDKYSAMETALYAVKENEEGLKHAKILFAVKRNNS